MAEDRYEKSMKHIGSNSKFRNSFEKYRNHRGKHRKYGNWWGSRRLFQKLKEIVLKIQEWLVFAQKFYESPLSYHSCRCYCVSGVSYHETYCQPSRIPLLVLGDTARLRVF